MYAIRSYYGIESGALHRAANETRPQWFHFHRLRPDYGRWKKHSLWPNLRHCIRNYLCSAIGVKNKARTFQFAIMYPIVRQKFMHGLIIVITSYSIHYTKLYDNATTWWFEKIFVLKNDSHQIVNWIFYTNFFHWASWTNRSTKLTASAFLSVDGNPSFV